MAVARLIFGREWKTLWSDTDLLVPYGIVVGLEAVVMWIAATGVFGGSTALNLFGLAISVSASLVLYITLWTAFAAWTVSLIVDAQSSGNVDLGTGWRRGKAHFWRVLLALALCVLVSLVVLALAMPLLGGGAIALVLPLMILSTLVLNLGTMALLPAVVTSKQSAWGAVREGVGLSWASKRTWFPWVLLQWGLLGGFTYYSVSFVGDHGTLHHASNWNVQMKSLAGFETETAWYGKYCEALKTSTVPLLSFFLNAAFVLLALVIKLRVVAQVADDLDGSGARGGADVIG